ncbi:DUF4865 family protein [Dyella sp. GSA-30]|uniref:DUF4865 family protein n=1 Tax=Dyella sp. GSA-30 TaxID=2994496 RepID=UPI002492A613|nr:DUF4865 family protein [Dyella sp. GSA-30]BDU19809.1 DUF4865 domain-containing protein [Dyella sp. GSA-30]
MIAMQYSFTFPADYDMAIIRRRIAEKGGMTDDFPHLAFKAYLSATRGDERLPSQENLYAPFYLWRNEKGMNAFLAGPGFAALCDAFGRPSIRLWPVWQASLKPEMRDAVCATRELLPIAPYADLEALRQIERDRALHDTAHGALAAVSAYEPGSWTMVRFRLWNELPPNPAQQVYAVGHMSVPAAAAQV